MLLTVDIGNTTIALGILQRKKMIRQWKIETSLAMENLRKALQKITLSIKNRNWPLEAIVICSVVPAILPVVKSQLENGLSLKACVIGRDIKVPIKNRYRNPKQVGQDRLVCAYAAMMTYGAPAIVIDLGTAITFDIVSQRREYLGGIIVSGIRLSAESLSKKTALLPKVNIQTPKAIIGRNTQESILSGLFYGYGALCSGLIESLAKKIHPRPTVIMTGCHAMIMKKFIASPIHALDNYLVFHGMQMLFTAKFSAIPSSSR